VIKVKKKTTSKLNYVLVRTYSAGVFAGYLKSKKGKEVILHKARRIYFWKGAATLSQLAMEGSSCPSGCKFPQEVDEIILTEAIEIISVTPKAQLSIASVPVWKV
jgi:hypothetical protein